MSTPPSAEGEPQSRPVTDVSGERVQIWVASALLALALCYSVYAASFGWTDAVGGAHDFRQTQTAITCFYMLRQPFALAYETPVLGPPWAIPMEFPLYQWLVVATAKLTGMALAPAGRFIGLAMFLGTLVSTYFLLAAMRVARPARLLVVALIAVSPFYIFWARTFMIETTALFLCTSYLACGVLSQQRHDRRLLVLAIVLGTLGALVKITTFLIFVVPLALYTAAPLLHTSPRSRAWWRVIRSVAVRMILLVGVAFILGLAWTKFADAVKEQNALGKYLTSEHLTSWNFGTLAQRLAPATWKLMAERATALVTADTAFWLMFAATAIVVRRRWKEVLGCLALFIAGPLVFTNLHVVHDYYMCANGIFLLGALGFCVVGLAEATRSLAAPVAAVFVAGLLAVSTHRERYLPAQKQDHQAIANGIQQNLAATDPESVTIYLGLDWSPVWPYYAERRALMIPEWGYVTDADVREALTKLRPYKIGRVVVSGAPRYSLDKLRSEMQALGFDTSSIEGLK